MTRLARALSTTTLGLALAAGALPAQAMPGRKAAAKASASTAASFTPRRDAFSGRQDVDAARLDPASPFNHPDAFIQEDGVGGHIASVAKVDQIVTSATYGQQRTLTVAKTDPFNFHGGAKSLLMNVNWGTRLTGEGGGIPDSQNSGTAGLSKVGAEYRGTHVAKAQLEQGDDLEINFSNPARVSFVAPNGKWDSRSQANPSGYNTENHWDPSAAAGLPVRF